MLRTAVIVVIAAALGVAGWSVFLANPPEDANSYRTASVERGQVVASVSTTGTLNAVITVQVGSQVSGQIKELGADYNSEVKAGEVIARIDPGTFEAKLRQAQAELEIARANVFIQQVGVERAEKELANAAANLASLKAKTEKSRVTLENSRRNMERRKALYRSGAVSESQTDDAETTHWQAMAQVKSDLAEEKAAESQLASREAAMKASRAQVLYAVEQVRLKEAALHQAAVDLENTYIRSPVDGVVIERAVDIGQTVAASFQAPKLFTIAQNLRRMQVETDVDEADIGRIHVSQRALFTVDAFPGTEFQGDVVQIRKNPRVVLNVVTYVVVVSALNEDLRLLPGMTANIQIIVDQRADALKVPNAALRFRPEQEDKLANGEMAVSAESIMPMERQNRLNTLLNLTDSQKKQVAMVLSEARERLAALQQQDVSHERQRREARVQRERVHAAIAALLATDQREKFIRWVSGEAGLPADGRVYLLSQRGRPFPVEISLGINDGAFTEVLGGELNEGQQVILGLMALPSKPSVRSATKRFGF